MLSSPLAVAGAQSVATVPSSSDVYRRLEAVSALFPVRGLHLGQRPQSQRALASALARLLAAVQGAPVARREREWALAEIGLLQRAIGDSASARSGLVMRVSLRSELFGSDARTETIANNGLGLLDAVTNPFAARRQGWPTPSGLALTFAPTVVVGVKNRAAVAVQPRLSAGALGAGREAEAMIHRAYGRAVFKNVALQLGADELLWGQSPYGALFISGNAAPAPAIVLSSDTGFTLPWWFRIAGPVRATAIVADLGPSQDPPYARLAGWQVSIQPWTRFELGVSILAQTGGRGGPRATFIERVVDLFPVIGAAFPALDNPISNKFAGGNLRLRIPELSGLDFYYELQFDDFDGRRLVSSFVDDAGHLLGARIARGSIVWRTELHRTSVRLYEHTQFRSGLTHRQRLIGSPLGPHAKAGYLGAEWQLSPETTIDLTLGDERRDPSLYTVTVSASRDRGFRFIRVSDDPDFRRARLIGTVSHTTRFGALRLSGGYNRAWVTGQPSRQEWLGQLSFATSLLPVF